MVAWVDRQGIRSVSLSFLMLNVTNIYLSPFCRCYCSTTDSDTCHTEGLNGPPTSIAWWGIIGGVEGFKYSHRSCPSRRYSHRNGRNGGMAPQTIVAGTRMRPMDLRRCPPETNRSIGNGSMGRGLQVEPSVVSVAASQPPQWPQRWHTMVARSNT